MNNDRFTFFSSYAEAFEKLDDADLAKLVRGMCLYAFDGADLIFDEPPLCHIWPLLKLDMDANAHQECE